MSTGAAVARKSGTTWNLILGTGAIPASNSVAPYLVDDGLGTNNGQEPNGFTKYSSLSGATDIISRAASAGLSVMSLGPGTYVIPGFTSNQYDHMISSAGMIGAGSAQTTLSQVANSSATDAVSGFLFRSGVAGGRLQDLSFVGTTQTVAPYNIWGGVVLNANDWTIRRVKLVGTAPGNMFAPPGETFALNLFKAYGTITVTDLEIDGAGKGASNFGTNGSGTDADVPTSKYVVNRVYSHNNPYSACFAFWQTKFDPASVFNDCVLDQARCFWNVERCSGTVTFNRPRIGTLHAATSGWDPAHGVGSAIGVFCESDAGWGAQASQDFRFIVNDPRNLDGTPYSGPKLGVTFGGAFDKGTDYYGRTNFKCYNSAGADISSSFFTYGGKPFN